MNTTSKKVVKKASAAESVPAPVAVPEASPAAPKKAVKKSTPAATEPISAPVAAPVVPAPSETSTSAEAADASTFETELASLQTQLTSIRDAASAALATLKRLAKKHTGEVKDARKNRKAKRTPVEGEAKRPNNFEKLVPISDELAAFLGAPKGAPMSRADVNRRMNEYYKSHGLQQGQKINPDAAVRKLLRIPEGDDVSIFTVQKYMKQHYPKVEKTA